MIADAYRPLHVLNAGSTPELGWARVLVHAGGRIVPERRLALGAAEARRDVVRATAGLRTAA
ncbi:hypothetical protein A2cp1_1043 [Anaeromyxobacter dehalogenans 2CP-1]|uniref:Uncharacterized protein n=1 Tax=Anaeromyxobacter dehalogenans (strain ATCC BAA-258 / DSM 21875 / 2CP-1) TaxID=455488 RepID=B8JF37_ANAD2|nr:hypothetical protein [Anaeromyxobacter dehalogenans]ACL64394.1 hypothetical protein A2cp1_1043 [Anaeromyxobacter dehalogenans 2CP-1]